jgi:hypothetical protein
MAPVEEPVNDAPNANGTVPNVEQVMPQPGHVLSVARMNHRGLTPPYCRTIM